VFLLQVLHHTFPSHLGHIPILHSFFISLAYIENVCIFFSRWQGSQVVIHLDAATALAERGFDHSLAGRSGDQTTMANCDKIARHDGLTHSYGITDQPEGPGDAHHLSGHHATVWCSGAVAHDFNACNVGAGQNDDDTVQDYHRQR
jgi:hypothetical protein